MKEKKTPSPLSPKELFSSSRRLHAASMVEYFGAVSHAANERVFGVIKERLSKSLNAETTLLVCSSGGPDGVALGFYDLVRHVLRPRLTTVCLGEVSAAGVLIFLSGKRRLVGPHATVLLRPSETVGFGTVSADNRASADTQYAQAVADASGGKLTPTDVLELMRSHSALHPKQLIELGLANGVVQ